MVRQKVSIAHEGSGGLCEPFSAGTGQTGTHRTEVEAITKMPNSPISASDLNRNPQNIYIYSSGYDSSSSLILVNFSIFEMASIFIEDHGVLWKTDITPKYQNAIFQRDWIF